jgi:hypothetical protein
MDLNDRYENELRDPLFDAKVHSYNSDPNDEDAVDPWDTIADKSGNPEDTLFSEPEPENPRWQKRAASLMRNAAIPSRTSSLSISVWALRLRICARLQCTPLFGQNNQT